LIQEQDLESDIESSVWYAVYGSNLLKERFLCYLEGKEFRTNTTVLSAPPRCEAGTQIHGHLPFNDQPFKVPFKLYFAHTKSKWGHGGVAFVEIEQVHPPPTLGRAYLLTLQQLKCLAREENGGSHPIDIKHEMLFGSVGTTHEITTDQQGWYRILLLCGSLNYKVTQLPVVTLTGQPEEAVPRYSPSPIYHNTIWKGLHQTYPDKPDYEIEEYLKLAEKTN
jgi:hypothetical protein